MKSPYKTQKKQVVLFGKFWMCDESVNSNQFLYITSFNWNSLDTSFQTKLVSALNFLCQRVFFFLLTLLLRDADWEMDQVVTQPQLQFLRKRSKWLRCFFAFLVARNERRKTNDWKKLLSLSLELFNLVGINTDTDVDNDTDVDSDADTSSDCSQVNVSVTPVLLTTIPFNKYSEPESERKKEVVKS